MWDTGCTSSVCHSYDDNVLNVSEDNRDIIRSSDNDSTGFWPPGSLHTLGADGHI